jgi:phenylpyruvate tautomerase PptA (4-oxalocrotonate tautomerase family)
MPLVRIEAPPDLDDARRAIVSDCIQEALVAAFSVPPDDRFHIFASRAGARVYDRSYLGIERTDGTIFIAVTLRRGRTVEQKRAFYASLARLLSERAGIAPADVFAVLTENGSEDWSFGDGIAQYARE